MNERNFHESIKSRMKWLAICMGTAMLINPLPGVAQSNTVQSSEKGSSFLKPFTADALLRKVQELLPSVKLESIEYEHRLIVNHHARKDNVPCAVALLPSQAENVLNEVSP